MCKRKKLFNYENCIYTGRTGRKLGGRLSVRQRTHKSQDLSSNIFLTYPRFYFIIKF